MRKYELKIGSKVYKGEVPADLNEMDAERFIDVMELCYGEIESETFFHRYFRIPMEALMKLDVYTSYMLSTLIQRIEADSTLQKFIIPQVKLIHGRHTFIFLAPNENLYKMSFQQFMTIDTYYTWYLQTKQNKYLTMMAVCMYLQEGERIDEVEEDERFDIWANVRPAVIHGILVNWTMIKNWLGKCYPYLFPGGSKTADERPGAHVKVKMFNGWSEIMDTMVGDDLTRIESYRNLETMDVLRILNRRIKKQKERRFR